MLGAVRFLSDLEDRRIVTAFAYNYTPEQIAGATGIPTSVVRARFQAAIATIVAGLAG